MRVEYLSKLYDFKVTESLTMHFLMSVMSGCLTDFADQFLRYVKRYKTFMAHDPQLYYYY